MDKIILLSAVCLMIFGIHANSREVCFDELFPEKSYKRVFEVSTELWELLQEMPEVTAKELALGESDIFFQESVLGKLALLLMAMQDITQRELPGPELEGYLLEILSQIEMLGIKIFKKDDMKRCFNQQVEKAQKLLADGNYIPSMR